MTARIGAWGYSRSSARCSAHTGRSRTERTCLSFGPIPSRCLWRPCFTATISVDQPMTVCPAAQLGESPANATPQTGRIVPCPLSWLPNPRHRLLKAGERVRRCNARWARGRFDYGKVRGCYSSGRCAWAFNLSRFSDSSETCGRISPACARFASLCSVTPPRNFSTRRSVATATRPAGTSRFGRRITTRRTCRFSIRAANSTPQASRPAWWSIPPASSCASSMRWPRPNVPASPARAWIAWPAAGRPCGRGASTR